MTDVVSIDDVDDAPQPVSGTGGEADLHRIPGETVPRWLVAGMTALGLALAVLSASLLFSEPPPPEETVVLAPAAPVAPPAPTPSAPTPRSETAPSAAVAPATPPSTAPEAAPSEPATDPASAPATPAPEAAAPSAPVIPPPPPPPVEAPAAVVAAPVAPVAPPVAAPPAPAPCLPVIGLPFARASSRLDLADIDDRTLMLRRWMEEHPTAVLSVEGHADTSGTEDYNVVLSFSRARAVIAWLARAGVPEARMMPRAAGTSQPRNLPSGTTTNRLVILQVDGVEICRDATGAARQP